MPELIVKYKSQKALKALQDLSNVFDIIIEQPVKANADAKKAINLPVTYASHPDITALAGIWEGRDITLDELRKEAWGNRP